ncbi:MAG: murein biosynthesis integral membrane protein MurJ [Planctomycetes bacterium GWF2_41_51]|nr:MAG: murein biosynthesis integral membrane protein MurJ [Planctomycetes bacterium GWF2_41_51]HBG27560.1 murein biosynthesis integral membrane protein MurJ [Phycisphaerales bacterium]
MGIKAENEHKEREHFFNAAKVVAFITLISRVFGFFRDMGIASLGTTRYNDAFGLAFKIPNLFRRLFGEGALASAFVPVFTDIHEKEGSERAKRLLANSFALLAVFLAVLLVIGELGFFFYSLVPGPKDRSFLMLLAIIMYPYMFTVCLLALCSAALNARGHFIYPAAAPIIFNIFGIIAAWWLAPYLKENLQNQLVLVAFSVVVAGVVQLAAVLWLLTKSGLFIFPFIRPMEPGIKQIIRLVTPMLLGLGFLQFSEFFQDVIAWNLTYTEQSPMINIFGWSIPCPLKEGVIVRVGAARAFYQFPMGVLAISLGVAVFPLLSRYASRGDIPNLRDSINRAIRLSLMEGISTGVGLFILAEPIMMIYARRRFTVADSMQAALVLKMYVLGMWAYCSYQILARAFYACKDTKTPLKISCVLSVVNLLLLVGLVWIPGIGPGAFGLSTSITFTLNALILIFLLRRRMGLLGGRKIAACLVRAAISCTVMAIAVYLLKWNMREVNNLIVLGVCVPAGAIVFVFMLWVLKAPELYELIGGIKHRQEISAAQK